MTVPGYDIGERLEYSEHPAAVAGFVDEAGAVKSHLASLAGLAEHCSGFHYVAPMAELALAERSREHALRMPHRKDEVVLAEQWLAAHDPL